MKANFSSSDIPRIKVDIKKMESIIKQEHFNKAMFGDENSRQPDVKIINVRKIRDSWIYGHFTNLKVSSQNNAYEHSQTNISFED